MFSFLRVHTGQTWAAILNFENKRTWPLKETNSYSLLCLHTWSADSSCLFTIDMTVAVPGCRIDSNTNLQKTLIHNNNITKPRSAHPPCLSATDVIVGVTGCTADSHSPPAVDGAAGGRADGHLSLPGAGPLSAGRGARHHQGECGITRCPPALDNSFSYSLQALASQWALFLYLLFIVLTKTSFI